MTLLKFVILPENKINADFSITNKESYSIFDVAKLFKSKIKILPPRKGEICVGINYLGFIK